MSDLDDVEGVDALYALDPGEFTAARNALAKQLKAAGEKAVGAEVAALRRPSASAGALNRVARSEPELVEEALAAGSALRQATEAAMDGDASGLREATAAERKAAASLVRAAERLLGSAGAGNRSKLSATVHAAVLDDEIADELRRGVLTADHDRSGLGLGFDQAVVAPAKARAKAKTKTEAEPKVEATKPAAGTDELAVRRRRKQASKDAADVERAEADRLAAEAAKREAAEQAAREAEEQARREEVARAHRKLVNGRRKEATRARREAERLDKAAVRKEAEADEARGIADDAESTAVEAAQALADAEAEAPEG